jgi:hypothetical protein
MQEVSRLVVFCSGLEAQCQEQCVSADGFFTVMDRPYQVAHIFIGSEAAAQLSPYHARPTGSLTVEEDKQNYTFHIRYFILKFYTFLNN